MRDAFEKFQAAEIALYAISYDDQQVLAEFKAKQRIPFRLISDIDSETIREYGILNDQVGREDAFLEGIPYPGVYVTDEDRIVVAKFFHGTYKKRDSPEILIDAALGKLVLSDEAPSVSGGDNDVGIKAFVHGGKGTIRQGILRQLIVRLELAEGLHIYVFPFYAVGQLASETRPLDEKSIKIEIGVRYQACGDQVCFLPKTEKLTLRVELDVIDVPDLGVHSGHGQREGSFRGGPHMARLMLRKLGKYPLGLPRLFLKTIRLEIAAKWRSLKG